MHCGRSHDTRGVKEVEATAQTKHRITESYTIQPLFSAECGLLVPMLAVLQESKGESGPHVKQTIFKPKKLHFQLTKPDEL